MLSYTALQRKLVIRMLGNGECLVSQVERRPNQTAAQRSSKWTVTSPKRPRSRSLAQSSMVIRKAVRAARQKLQAAQTPQLLQVSAYLQLCCLAIHKSTECLQPTVPARFTSARQRYLDLLIALNQCTPDWWQSCSITANYGLMSYDAAVQALLQPIEVYIQQLEQG